MDWVYFIFSPSQRPKNFLLYSHFHSDQTIYENVIEDIWKGSLGKENKQRKDVIYMMKARVKREQRNREEISLILTLFNLGNKSRQNRTKESDFEFWKFFNTF